MFRDPARPTVDPLAWPLLLLVAVGCARPSETTYALRADVEKLDLPRKQTAQVAAYLAMFHGSPVQPRMAAVDADAVETAVTLRKAEARDDSDVAAGPPGSRAGSVPGVSPIAGVDRVGFDRPTLELGRRVYTAACAGCHGTAGDGRGMAAPRLDPPPRDFRNGVFKFTSTPRGSKPRREDLRRVLCRDANGTNVPAYRFLSERETEAVIDYVQLLASRGELELALLREAETELDEADDFDPEVVAGYVTDIAASWRRAEEEVVWPVTASPPRTAETVRAGAVAFAELACATCHGADTRGSTSTDIGRDIWGRKARPTNLAMGVLRGGRGPVDVYRRIYSGINGTPMPAAKDPDTASGETPEQRSDRIWHLVHFVTTVVEENRVPPDCQTAIDDVLRDQARRAAAQRNAADRARAVSGVAHEQHAREHHRRPEQAAGREALLRQVEEPVVVEGQRADQLTAHHGRDEGGRPELRGQSRSRQDEERSQRAPDPVPPGCPPQCGHRGWRGSDEQHEDQGREDRAADREKGRVAGVTQLVP